MQILLVGNKVDTMNRQVNRSDGEKLAKNEGILYAETTIKDFGTIHKALELLFVSTFCFNLDVVKVSKYYNRNDGVNLNDKSSSSGCKC